METTEEQQAIAAPPPAAPPKPTREDGLRALWSKILQGAPEEIRRYPLHNAGPDLLEALERLADEAEGVLPRERVEAAREVIRRSMEGGR